MARHEQDREDLMREATALRKRVELAVPGESETVVAGLRDQCALSLFFGADPAFHFDAEGRLRRAYVEGRLYRTQGETLAQMTRVRSASRTELHRHDLTPEELDSFLRVIPTRLHNLQGALTCAACRAVSCVPTDWTFEEELHSALEQILATGLRLAPRIPGKR